MHIKSFPLPFATPLLSDYLRDSPKIRSFFPTDFRNNWREVLAARSGFSLPRKAVQEALERQNRRRGASAETLANIAKLGDPNTLAVVTGQQAGMLGGPLYTFYKTMTVLKLSDTLQRRYPQYNFIPVFWLEVNDSDFAEINHIHYIDQQNELQRLSLAEGPHDRLKPIADRKIPAEIAQWRHKLQEDFFDSEFKAAALDRFLGRYQAAHSYSEAFAALLNDFFRKYGLVLIDPTDDALLQLSVPRFQQALDEAPALYARFSDQSEAVQTAGYPAQIKPVPQQTFLFFQDEGGQRVRIDYRDDGRLALNYPDQIQNVTAAELRQRLNATSARLLPNVAMRPLMQDSLLPTAAYVAGPGEITYFAQLGALYRYFDIPMPVIYPRHSLTIVEGKLQKNIRKFALDYPTLLANRPDFIQYYLENFGDRTLYRALENTGKQIDDSLAALQKTIESADPTLLNPLEKTRQSIDSNFQKFSSRITRSLEEKSKTEVQQLEKILANLLPANNYQERVLSMVYFCIKYGLDFVDRLYEALPDAVDKHHVVEL